MQHRYPAVIRQLDHTLAAITIYVLVEIGDVVAMQAQAPYSERKR